MTEPKSPAGEIQGLVERAMALANAATPGPWTTGKPGTDEDGFALGALIAATPPRQPIYATPPGGSYPAADRAFIAASRQLIPELCEAITRLSQPAWRCFHCGEVFTTEDAALDHFGTDETRNPACQINAAEYRRMEEVHNRHLTETDDASREFYAMRADHAAALIREEERGYARGLADARLSQPSGEEIREAAAKIAERDTSRDACPFGSDRRGSATWNLTEDDPCPVCGQTGKEDGSKCWSFQRNRVAAAIRALPLSSPAREIQGLVERLREPLTVHLPQHASDATLPIALENARVIRRMMVERAEAADAITRLSQPSGEEIREAALDAIRREKDHWYDDVSALTALSDAAARIRALLLSSGSNKSDDGKKGQPG